MTIAAGFVAQDGILLCTDSQVTSNEKAYRPKMFTEYCGGFRIGFALSGDEDYAKTAVFDAFERVNTLRSGSTLSKAKKEIRIAIKEVVKDCDVSKLEPYQRPALLVAISNESEQGLFSTRDAAMSPVQSYACLGSGGYLGQYIIPLLLPYPSLHVLSIRSLVPIALYMMAAAKRVDAYCGGGSDFVAIRGMESRQFKFLDALTSDALFEKYDRLAGQLLFYLTNTEPSRIDFKDKLSALGEHATAFRTLMLDANSPYSKLLNHLSPLRQQDPESTTGDPS